MGNFWETLNQVGKVMPVIGFFVGLVAAVIVFFWFMSKKNKGRFTGLPGWLYEFLQFRNYIVEVVLKFSYVVAACICTGIGVFSILSLQLPMGLGFLLGGNLLLRILYEIILMLVMTFKNVSQINQKMSDKGMEKMETFEFKKPPMPRKEDFIATSRIEAAGQLEMEPVTRQQKANEEIAATTQPEPEKHCPDCGKQLREEDLFCSQCGKKVLDTGNHER